MALKIEKIAADDAARYAYAEMFFGEGAGTMRKLVFAEVDHKVSTIPGYREAFQKQYEKINMADVAIKAAKDRKTIDKKGKLTKNIGALARGDRRGMTNGFAALVMVGSIAVVTGYDKKIVAEGKKQYRKAKNSYENYKRRQKGEPEVHDIRGNA